MNIATGSGKSALTLALARMFRDKYNIGESYLIIIRRDKLIVLTAILTNDIFTRKFIFSPSLTQR